MFSERDPNIPKLMWTVQNQKISIMEEIKAHICLSIRAWLNRTVANSGLISKKICNDPPDVLERYLRLRERVDSDNRQVVVLAMRPPHEYPSHVLPSRNHDPLCPSWHEGPWINKAVGHVKLTIVFVGMISPADRSRNCIESGIFRVDGIW